MRNHRSLLCGAGRVATTLAVVCLLSALASAQESVVPNFGTSPTVAACRQAASSAPGGPRDIKVVEIIAEPNDTRFDAKTIIEQHPAPAAILTDGHLMHVVISPLDDDDPSEWEACAPWIIVVIIEFIVIVILILRLRRP